ncbi:hypothetical protein DV515_00011367 [Chloebia gouldiae]|uniref:Uncharacterized protein n=1 Tax=Chloebia gouldiae TaxID=44316 RepID=A0A3L8S7X8_CHLGU|nr:hypothetical protein DV515_00011367 [Chloebia gouldiae]
MSERTDCDWENCCQIMKGLLLAVWSFLVIAGAEKHLLMKPVLLTGNKEVLTDRFPVYLLEISVTASPKFGQKKRVSYMDEVEMEVAMCQLPPCGIWKVEGGN